MSYHCPSCHGVLYDRRRKTCGFCGVALPAELLFTPAELEQRQREEAVAERHRQQRIKEQAEAEEQARRARGSLDIPFSGD